MKKVLLAILIIIIILLLILVLTGSEDEFVQDLSIRSSLAPQAQQLGFTDISAEDDTVVLVDIRERNNSDVSGLAVLDEVNGQARVRVVLENTEDGVEQPMHIHEGRCGDIGEILYPLNNIVDGQSSTTLDATLREVLAMRPIAINAHESADALENNISCGNVILTAAERDEVADEDADDGTGSGSDGDDEDDENGTTTDDENGTTTDENGANATTTGEAGADIDGDGATTSVDVEL